MAGSASIGFSFIMPSRMKMKRSINKGLLPHAHAKLHSSARNAYQAITITQASKRTTKPSVRCAERGAEGGAEQSKEGRADDRGEGGGRAPGQRNEVSRIRVCLRLVIHSGAGVTLA
jgi:hypothetical protein